MAIETKDENGEVKEVEELSKAKVSKGSVRGKKYKCIKLEDGTKVFQPEEDIESLFYNALGEKFTNGGVTKTSWLAGFIDTNLNSLKKAVADDPNTSLSALREIGKVATKTQAYFDKKKTVDTDFSRYLLRSNLFPYQQNVYDDINKRITMLWGRRAGKTHTAARLAYKMALEKEEKPREIIIMGLTLEKTAGLYWEELKKAAKDAHIPVQKTDAGSYTIILSNGNSIQLWGNNSKAEREKLRGKDTYAFIIDEMQSQQGLYYLLTDIISPIIRGRNGVIICLGTAPISAGTKWEEIINDPAWSHSSATMENNPTIPDFEHALQNVLEENHWTKDNITFRREYLGEIAYDTERMILPTRKYYKDLPKDFKPTHCVIGVDYGWQDFSSFAPIIFDDQYNMYLVKEWKQNKTASSEIVQKMKVLIGEIQKEYNIPVEDIKIVADSSHQQISQDIYNQGVTNITNAYKLDEQYQWSRLGEALAIGDLQILENGEFDKECDALVWKWNSEKGCVIYQVDDDTFHPDIADSVKYALNTIITERNTAQ